MNAKRIRIIIVLMTVALIGIISLQVYWIRWNIGLNEAQFDKNVLAALNRVADKLGYYDNLSMMDNMGAADGGRQLARTAPVFAENGYALRRRMQQDTQNGKKGTKDASFNDISQEWERAKVDQMVEARPLAERIQLDMLAQSITEEMSNRGILPPYQFGIYSKARNSYIIVNDHYVVEDENPLTAQGGAPTLFNSPYKVNLFTQDIESPGHLSIYFPNRTSLVLGSVWFTLLMSVLFTGIILFCFWYTIQVIFRQKQLSEMKTDFINNMTHEFKTPIATISLAADSIGSPMILNNPDKIRRFVDIIRQENRRMNSQVERVLQVALIDKKDIQLRLGQVDLNEIVEQVVGNFSLQVEKRDGVLHTDLQADNAGIEGDATHLVGIIHNLLDNANKYSPEKPEITVRTRNVPVGIEVTVQDKGIGISKEVRKHIFDKFYRVHTGDVHDVKGFGLGLSYVKAIMTAHKGFVDVKSEPGKGSSFILTFPV
jgi:two-component system, OmpR family, phosphate regulon sensor histidine kinase PhoR